MKGVSDNTPDLLTLLEYVGGGLDFKVSYELASSLGIIGVDLSICIAIYITGGHQESYDSLISYLEDGDTRDPIAGPAGSPLGIARACRVQYFARYARARGKGKTHNDALSFIASI
jgi:hypothetical protein